VNWSFSLYDQGRLREDEVANFVEGLEEAKGVTQFKARQSLPPPGDIDHILNQRNAIVPMLTAHQ